MSVLKIKDTNNQWIPIKSNPRSVQIETTVTDAAIENDYYILGGKTGILDNGSSAAALIMVAKPKT